MKENKIKAAFSKVRAPESVLREVKMKTSDIEAKRTHIKRKRYGKLIPIAAALAAILALSAAAAYGVMHAEFYNDAFGTGVKGQTGGPTDYYDRDGNLVKTVDEPAIERIEVDPEQAEKLVGEAVQTLNSSVSANGYTATVLDYVFDENGFGTVTVEIENQSGRLPNNRDFADEFNDGAFTAWTPFQTDDGTDINLPDWNNDIYEESSPTKWRFSVSIAPYSDTDGRKNIKFVLFSPNELAQSISAEERKSNDFNYSQNDLYDRLEIPLPISNRLKSSAFACGTRVMRISPLGMWIKHGPNDKNNDFLGSCVIDFKDGSKYIVTDDTHLNYDAGLNDGLGNCWLHFNRLVNNEAIEKITVVDYAGVEHVFTSVGDLVDQYDNLGNLVKTVYEPENERVDVDPEKAQALIGDYVGSVNASEKVMDYTVTVHEFVFDENGVGSVTVDIEHPEGHTRFNKDWWNENQSRYPNCHSEHFETADRALLADRVDVVESECTETRSRVVYTVAPLNEADELKDIVFVFEAATPYYNALSDKQLDSNDFDSEKVFESVRIPINVTNRVEATEFVCEDKKIAISPIGAKLTLGVGKLPEIRQFSLLCFL